ncbi:MAG: hypothetical protein Q9P44_14720 [Anaerolineae bacterium]|nr:hypothetical protein [Anaerolineae bacterium]
MTHDLTGEYQHIFMSIELNVTNFYRQHPNLVDHNIDKIFAGIQRTLEKELQNRKPPKLRWKGAEEDLFNQLMDLSRIVLGEEEFDIVKDGNEIDEDDINDEDMDEDDEPIIETISKETMVKIMRRLRRSINTWSGSNAYGRRGYLNYISQFM